MPSEAHRYFNKNKRKIFLNENFGVIDFSYLRFKDGSRIYRCNKGVLSPLTAVEIKQKTRKQSLWSKFFQSRKK